MDFLLWVKLPQEGRILSARNNLRHRLQFHLANHCLQQMFKERISVKTSSKQAYLLVVKRDKEYLMHNQTKVVLLEDKLQWLVEVSDFNRLSVGSSNHRLNKVCLAKMLQVWCNNPRIKGSASNKIMDLVDHWHRDLLVNNLKMLSLVSHSNK
jgi:hypothetical protein